MEVCLCAVAGSVGPRLIYAQVGRVHSRKETEEVRWLAQGHTASG